MNIIELLEQECAEAVLAHAYNLALTYNQNAGDRDAAILALLARAVEIHLERPVNIFGMLNENC
jgi:hypothetical protein